MTDPIFAIPRTVYGSYSDLYSLIDLSGYSKVFIDEINPDSDNCYICTIRNSESEPGWPNAKARIIICDLEWRTAPEALPPGVREIWRGDAWQVGVAGGRYIPLGSHPHLKAALSDVLVRNNAMFVKQYDTAYIGYMPPRRQRIEAELDAKGVTRTPIHAWGEERGWYLAQSKTYLHVHQLDHAPGIPILRMVVAAAYSLPFITETCANPGIFTNHILSADYAHLAEFTAMWARERHTQALDEKARGLHQLLTVDYTFRRSIEQAL